MKRYSRCFGFRFVFAFLLFSIGAPRDTPAQDSRNQASQNPELDRKIFSALRDVINTGADIYNTQQDRAGCARMYQGSLLTLRPLLAHHPELQKTIETGLAESERAQDPGVRAFALRRVLDTIFNRLKPTPVARRPVEKKPPIIEPPPKETRREPAKLDLPPSTLWLRLGGETGVKALVDDWVARAGPDLKVNFTRGGKYRPTGAQLADLKNKLVAFISQISDGPLSYKGKSMKEVHKSMGITDAEFDAFVADLRLAMSSRRMSDAEVQELTKRLDATRRDVVEPLKPEDKKSPPKSEPRTEEKKPELKKEDRKSPPTRPDSKKEEKKATGGDR